MFSFLLYKYLVVKFLNHKLGVVVTKQEIARLFFKMFFSFYTPTRNVWEFQLFHILVNT